MKEIKNLVKILTIENEDDMCNFEFEMHGNKFRFLISPDAFDLAILDYRATGECICHDDGSLTDEMEELPIATICVHDNSLLQGKIHPEWRDTEGKNFKDIFEDLSSLNRKLIKAYLESIKD